MSSTCVGLNEHGSVCNLSALSSEARASSYVSQDMSLKAMLWSELSAPQVKLRACRAITLDNFIFLIRVHADLIGTAFLLWKVDLKLFIY